MFKEILNLKLIVKTMTKDKTNGPLITLPLIPISLLLKEITSNKIEISLKDQNQLQILIFNGDIKKFNPLL
jgi:hypothetical protein